jgi:hypothetical protein
VGPALSIEGQVHSLIQEATDPRLLYVILYSHNNIVCNMVGPARCSDSSKPKRPFALRVFEVPIWQSLCGAVLPWNIHSISACDSQVYNVHRLGALHVVGVVCRHSRKLAVLRRRQPPIQQVVLIYMTSQFYQLEKYMLSITRTTAASDSKLMMCT